MAEPDAMRQDNQDGTNFQTAVSGGQVQQAGVINNYGSAPLPSGEANPFGVPYQRNRFFTGREQILADLHGQLTASGSSAITQIQAISGLGGIGKTQTAVEYAYRHFQDQPTYSHVFWVKADTEVNLSSDFAQLAVQLALPAAQGKEEEKLAAVQAWLANHDGWLLVFDNADEPEWLTPLMPTNPRGKVLLTSRATIFDEVGIRSPLALDVLSLAESLELIFERTGFERSEAAVAVATELNKELDGLPLALEQASAFMLRKRVGLTTYLKTFRKAGLAQLEKVKAKTGNYPSSVVTTWALNMQAVAAEAPAAAELLTFSAFLAPDAIPYHTKS